MARVLIVSSNADIPFNVWRHSTAFLLKHSAELDKFRQHSLTEDPADADIILFAEMGTAGTFAEMVRAHPYYRRFAEKCFIFENAYRAVPLVPGLYSSLTREQYRLGFTRTGFYLYLIQNPFLHPQPCTGKEKYLASFVGSTNTHPVRKKLFDFGRPDIYTKDTSEYSQRTTFHGDPAERARFWAEYAASIAEARFSLCPRGVGAGSIRLFESMKMGRACVILSDDWQPNDGVPWSEFSITVAENQVHRIPEILDRLQDRAAEMGAAARRAWEERFSEQACFHYVTEQCLEIRKSAPNGGWARTARLLRTAANPENWRLSLSSKRNLYRETGRVYW